MVRQQAPIAQRIQPALLAQVPYVETMFKREYHYVCPNCGYEGPAPIQGPGKLLWVVLFALVWNAWLFHRIGLEWEALVACLVALVSGWLAFKLPRWVVCPACAWKHPLDRLERQKRGL